MILHIPKKIVNPKSESFIRNEHYISDRSLTTVIQEIKFKDQKSVQDCTHLRDTSVFRRQFASHSVYEYFDTINSQI